MSVQVDVAVKFHDYQAAEVTKFCWNRSIHVVVGQIQTRDTSTQLDRKSRRTGCCMDQSKRRRLLLGLSQDPWTIVWSASVDMPNQ